MAGLIPQSFIDDLLARTDLVELISTRVPLKKTGKNYSARCPFHDEKSPSFTVSSEKQFYYCFGCGAKGNALGFLMQYDHLDFPRAVEELAHRAGMEVPHEADDQNQQAKKASQAPLYELLNQAAVFYQQALKAHPHRQLAVTYLKKRGLSGAIARDFALGFAPPGWDNLAQALGQTEAQQQLMLETGLLVEKDEQTHRRYDRFRERIIFPIRDNRGRVIAFGGRVLGDERPKYLNSPESPVFHKGQALYGIYEVQKFNRHLDELIVVEGYMDVIALAQQGIRNAVAVLGTATTTEHIRQLFRLTPHLLFCFDGDIAGRKAAWRALEACLNHLEDNRLVRFLFLPEGDDPDSLIRREGSEAFKLRTQQQAQTLAEYCFQHLAETLNINSIEGKAQLSALITPIIGQIPSTHLRASMQHHLSQLTGLTPQLAVVATTEAKVDASPAKTMAYDTAFTHRLKRQQPQTIVERPILKAIQTLLHDPQLAKKVAITEKIETNDPEVQLLAALLQLLQQQPQLTTLQLMARWHGTTQGQILCTLVEKEWLISDEHLEQQFFDTINNLVTRQREHTLDALLQKAREAELSAEEKNHLRRLLQRGSSISPAMSSGAEDRT